MIASEDEEEGGEASEEGESVVMEEKELELMLNSSSMDGFNSPKTMNFFGEIGGR